MANERSQNSRLPMILDSGSPVVRRSATSWTFQAAEPSGDRGSTINPTGEMPEAAQRLARASRAGSSIPAILNVFSRLASASERAVEASNLRPSVKQPGRDNVCIFCPSRTGTAHCDRPGPMSRDFSGRDRPRRLQRSQREAQRPPTPRRERMYIRSRRLLDRCADTASAAARAQVAGSAPQPARFAR